MCVSLSLCIEPDLLLLTNQVQGIDIPIANNLICTKCNQEGIEFPGSKMYSQKLACTEETIVSTPVRNSSGEKSNYRYNELEEESCWVSRGNSFSIVHVYFFTFLSYDYLLPWKFLDKRKCLDKK